MPNLLTGSVTKVKVKSTFSSPNYHPTKSPATPSRKNPPQSLTFELWEFATGTQLHQVYAARIYDFSGAAFIPLDTRTERLAVIFVRKFASEMSKLENF
ncbi:hypothetical protein Zmor_027624 [Zophobas morio]|uniref:Uncharacterized protein n=1 Tax=Zophobas morio TaxID=2755281 RepID=A0AA38HPP4_9CUCU|nr:hypothetical protein Zmor_027624 [Zophobas morio]